MLNFSKITFFMHLGELSILPAVSVFTYLPLHFDWALSQVCFNSKHEVLFLEVVFTYFFLL